MSECTLTDRFDREAARKRELNIMFGGGVQVHQHGFVRLVDFMGDDAAVVQAARTSYGAGTKTLSDDRKLLRFMLRQSHTSPFEMCVIKLHIKLPIFVARQWMRYRMCSFNEMSGRYSEMPDEFFIPAASRVAAQSTTNKQGSGEPLSSEIAEDIRAGLQWSAKTAFDVYSEALESGVSRELARVGLPLGTYTEFYWTVNALSLMHFLHQRLDPHAQEEIREYSAVLSAILAAWLPLTHEAFIDYRVGAVTFSAQAMMVLRGVVASVPASAVADLLLEQGVDKRETSEVISALYGNAK